MPDSLSERLLAQGIRLSQYTPGITRKITCPQCSTQRRNRKDPCLSVTINPDGESAVWNCHNCGWGGSTRPEKQGQSSKPKRKRPQPEAIRGPTVEVMRWFLNRGITPEVVQRNKIGFAPAVYMPKLGRKVDCIAFPYYRGGELINVKYRALEEKAFVQVKDAEPIFFGLDDLAELGADDKVKRGECDKLAAEVAGFRHVISVPDGAPAALKSGTPDPGDPKFAFLANCADELLAVKGGFILAVDNDEAGAVLEEELGRRIGKERCWRVRWPDGNDAPCKDANETLLAHGADVLRESIERAEPYPISGLYGVADYADAIWELYEKGHNRGVSTGWKSLDPYLTIAPGQLTTVTGVPHHGKSEFIDALLVNLVSKEDERVWRIAYCSFENDPADHLIKLFEKHTGAPFWGRPNERMSAAAITKAIAWASKRFWFIRSEDDAPATIDWILEKARAAVLRHGSNILVIDPYNEIEHRRPNGMTETEYVSEMLGKVLRFAKNHAVHVFFVAHPTKQPPPPANVKKPLPVGLYDISGSANWANKTDNGITVHRPSFDDNEVTILITKVRHKWIGRPGEITLNCGRCAGDPAGSLGP
jgi:twinkle protein